MESKLTALPEKPETMPAKRAAKLPAEKQKEMETVPGELVATSPWACAAGVVEAFGQFAGSDLDISRMGDAIIDGMKAIKAGDLSLIEQMLYGQALALQAVFTNSARKAKVETNLKLYQTHMGWALKAQAQSRATLQALVELKQPKSAVFVKQQNVGAQQQIVGGDIHNGESSRAEKPAASNKLNALEYQHGEYLDTGKASAPSATHTHLATVGTVHRTKIRQRQSAR